ncbi:MAG TPA: hypothetical protein PKX93_02085 [bacterium]|nr:hypothetical protein [bacterium]
MFWANLVHLSFNMWEEAEVQPPPGFPGKKLLEIRKARPYLRFEEPFYQTLTEKMKAAGMNMIVLDLGDGVRYQSHPEIAVKGAWSPEKLKMELAVCVRWDWNPFPNLIFPPPTIPGWVLTAGVFLQMFTMESAAS